MAPTDTQRDQLRAQELLDEAQWLTDLEHRITKHRQEVEGKLRDHLNRMQLDAQK